MVLHDIKPHIASSGLKRFMFLASHGLRTPLTEISWGCGRLKKIRKNSEKEEKILTQIHMASKQLSRSLGSIFLITRVQDGLYSFKTEKVNVLEIIQNSYAEEGRGLCVQCDCDPAIEFVTEKEIFAALMSDFIAAAIDSLNIDAEHIHVSVKQDDSRALEITMSAELDLAFLRNIGVNNSSKWSEADRIIGGSSGLLLALASDLANALQGKLGMQDQKEENEEEYTFVLTVPEMQ